MEAMSVFGDSSNDLSLGEQIKLMVSPEYYKEKIEPVLNYKDDMEIATLDNTLFLLKCGITEETIRKIPDGRFHDFTAFVSGTGCNDLDVFEEYYNEFSHDAILAYKCKAKWGSATPIEIRLLRRGEHRLEKYKSKSIELQEALNGFSLDQIIDVCNAECCEANLSFLGRTEVKWDSCINDLFCVNVLDQLDKKLVKGYEVSRVSNKVDKSRLVWVQYCRNGYTVWKYPAYKVAESNFPEVNRQYDYCSVFVEGDTIYVNHVKYGMPEIRPIVYRWNGGNGYRAVEKFLAGSKLEEKYGVCWQLPFALQYEGWENLVWGSPLVGLFSYFGNNTLNEALTIFLNEKIGPWIEIGDYDTVEVKGKSFSLYDVLSPKIKEVIGEWKDMGFPSDRVFRKCGVI